MAEHHRRFLHEKKIRKLLKRHRLVFDELFVWDDARLSAALVRQSSRNTDAEKRPRGGLEVLSGRFSLGTFPGLKAWAVLYSPFGRCKTFKLQEALLAKPARLGLIPQDTSGTRPSGDSAAGNFRVPTQTPVSAPYSDNSENLL